MSPIVPFNSMRYAVEEVSVWRLGMPHPRVGDLIERDSQQVRVTRVWTRPAGMGELDARPDLGEYMLVLEYEPFEVDTA